MIDPWAGGLKFWLFALYILPVKDLVKVLGLETPMQVLSSLAGKLQPNVCMDTQTPIMY